MDRKGRGEDGVEGRRLHGRFFSVPPRSSSPGGGIVPRGAIDSNGGQNPPVEPKGGGSTGVDREVHRHRRLYPALEAVAPTSGTASPDSLARKHCGPAGNELQNGSNSQPENQVGQLFQQGNHQPQRLSPLSAQGIGVLHHGPRTLPHEVLEPFAKLLEARGITRARLPGPGCAHERGTPVCPFLGRGGRKVKFKSWRIFPLSLPGHTGGRACATPSSPWWRRFCR